MKQTVYVDVLVSINLIVDYFLLYAAAVIAGRKRDRIRMCLGAVIGAASSLIIFLPPLPMALSLLLVMLTSALMTLAAFGWRSAPNFARTLVVLYALSAGYSGVMLLLWGMGKGGVTVNNGAVYINIDPGLLILSTIVLYAALSFFSGRVRARSLRRARCTITVYGENSTAELEGLIDTGNMLTEPFSGLPVIVASERKLQGVLPEGISDSLSCVDISHKACRGGLRVIPYHTAGGDGLMPAYRPKRIDIDIGGKLIKDVSAYLAVSPKSCGASGDAVVNPDIIG